ncbi:MAG TPA: hypothetical protein VN682_20270 [Terriglobales bacterium]|nr:hypothetical protein [Terriglobales bacterium]
MPDTITGRISAQVRFEEPMDVGIFRRDIERSGIKCGADSIAPLSSGNLADPYTRGFGMPHQAFAKRQEFDMRAESIAECIWKTFATARSIDVNFYPDNQDLNRWEKTIQRVA